MIILTIFLFIIPYRRNGNKITRAFGEVDMNIVEVLERPCYMVFPLALVMLGSTTMASIICCFVMYYVIAQHDGLERYWDFKNITLIRIIIILIGVVILIGQIVRGYTLWETWIFYCVGYNIFDAIYFWRPQRVKENWEKAKKLANGQSKGRFIARFLELFNGDITVLPFFYVLMVAMLVFGYYNFR